MEILKFENAPAPRKSAPKKSNLKSLAGLATVAAVAVLGSTLAANISLGSGASLEFGQGVQVTAACDSSITISPKVSFVNGASPQFMLSTVSFTDVDARVEGCRGKTLVLNGYGDSTSTPLQLATNGASAETNATIGINANTPTSAAGTVVSGVAGGGAGSQTLAFDLGFSTPSATSGAVYKLTLQSQN